MPKHIPVHQIFAPAARANLWGATHIERLFNKIDKKPSGCWEWTGGRDGAGYGRLRIGKEFYGAHRAAYEMIRGPIPDGLSLDHLCRNPLCVNPAHLEPVTHQENVKRGKHPSRTHCLHGHERTPENTYVIKRGNGRVMKNCRVCALERYKNRRESMSKILPVDSPTTRVNSND